MKSIQKISLISAITLLLMGQVVSSSGDRTLRTEAFSETTWFAQRIIQTAIRSANKVNNQFYYAFDDTQLLCEDNTKEYFAFLDFRFSHNGITISKNGGRLPYRWKRPVLIDDHTFKVEFIINDCSLALFLTRLEKLNTNREYRSATPIQENDNENNSIKAVPQYLSFSFDSSSESACPIAGGSVYLLPDALVSDLDILYRGQSDTSAERKNWTRLQLVKEHVAMY